MEPSETQPAESAALPQSLKRRLEEMSRAELQAYTEALHHLIEKHVTRQREDERELAAANRALGQQNERLRRLISRDPMTGQLNSRGLAEALDREIARLAREGGNLLTISLDLINLKEVNDYLGHAWGDDLIFMTVDRIHTRLYDITARIGGDEFVVAMVNVEHDALERLRDDLTISSYGAVVHLGQQHSVWGDNGAPAHWAEERIIAQRLEILRGADQDMLVSKDRAEAEEFRALGRYLQDCARPDQDCRRWWWQERLEPLRRELERWRESEKQLFFARHGLLEE